MCSCLKTGFRLVKRRTLDRHQMRSQSRSQIQILRPSLWQGAKVHGNLLRGSITVPIYLSYHLYPHCYIHGLSKRHNNPCTSWIPLKLPPNDDARLCLMLKIPSRLARRSQTRWARGLDTSHNLLQISQLFNCYKKLNNRPTFLFT